MCAGVYVHVCMNMCVQQCTYVHFIVDSVCGMGTDMRMPQSQVRMYRSEDTFESWFSFYPMALRKASSVSATSVYILP